MAQRSDTIEVKRNLRARQPWHVRLRAANGRILVSTEQFPNRSNAIRAARALRGRLRAYTPIHILP